MKVSLYIIGTEITRGIIQDSHTKYISDYLTKLGYEIKRSVILPDDGSIESVLKLGAQDSDVLVITGGLGPTSDDMTRSIIASVAGVELVKDSRAWEELYRKVGERIHGSNEQQAYIPKGFDILPNSCGTACGFCGTFESSGREVFLVSLPGPPIEMQTMFMNHALPILAGKTGADDYEVEEYSSFLIPEARLDEIVKSCLTDDLKWGDRFQQFKISMYISGSERAKEYFSEEMTKLCGKGLFEKGNVEAYSLLEDHLVKTNRTISLSETFTCGLVSKVLTDIPNWSAWFAGSEAGTETSAEDIRLKTGASLGVKIEEDGENVVFSFSSDCRESEKVSVKFSSISRDAKRRRACTCALILARLYDCNFSLVDIISGWRYI